MELVLAIEVPTAAEGARKQAQNKRTMKLNKDSLAIKKRNTRASSERTSVSAHHSCTNDDPWKIKKVLIRNLCTKNKLLLGKETVSTYIIPYLGKDGAKLCKIGEGVVLNVWDVDTETNHELILRKWYIDSFMLTGRWRTDFVERRGLKGQDQIGFRWDSKNSTFFFSVLSRSQDLNKS